MDISMSADDAQGFIAEQRVCRLATTEPDGTPHSVPVWYVILDGHIYIDTSSTSKKSQNIRYNPKACLTIDKGEEFDDFKGVMMQGVLDEEKDEQIVERCSEALAQKYFGSTAHPGFLFLSNLPNRILYRFRVEKTVSWDSSRMELE